MTDLKIKEAVSLMDAFAERTGLTSGRRPQRYLWTDAFAVCNYLGLARATGEPRYMELALRLVEQTHHTLGRHRHDAPRSGWISGLGEREGEAHPTRGGLRIGKDLPERGPDDAFDERLEWDRDGQYFHYLTKWMHALDQVSRATKNPRFSTWAHELAATAHRAFSYTSKTDGALRMLVLLHFHVLGFDPIELAYLFLTIAIGLGLGADQIKITVAAFALIVALIWVGLLLLFEIFYSKRAWCRYACPIGLTYGVVGAFSPLKVTYELESCFHEGECRKVCEVPHVLDMVIKGRATDTKLNIGADCTHCGRCVDACPTGSLNLNFKGLGEIFE